MDSRTIGNKLLDLGFNPADRGFPYLIDAIQLYRIGDQMTRIYDQVADKHKSHPGSVERSIRVSKEKTKAFRDLTNKEAIARIRWALEGEEEKK